MLEKYDIIDFYYVLPVIRPSFQLYVRTEVNMYGKTDRRNIDKNEFYQSDLQNSFLWGGHSITDLSFEVSVTYSYRPFVLKYG